MRIAWTVYIAQCLLKLSLFTRNALLFHLRIVQRWSTLPRYPSRHSLLPYMDPAHHIVSHTNN